MNNANLIVLIVCLLIWSCKEQYTPKPEGYPRIKLPEKTYHVYDNPSCPFTFEIPTYSKIVRDSVFFGEAVKNPCWLNLEIDQLNSALHLSYKHLSNRNQLVKVLEDVHQLTFKHAIRADFIEEKHIQKDNSVSGMWYDVGGDAASSVQFFLTDSAQHFIRGALYFNAPSNSDSLAPAIDFLKTDIDHLINTFDWK